MHLSVLCSTTPPRGKWWKYMGIWLKRVPCSNLDPRPFFVWKRVWGKALLGSVLSAWILSSVLMKERMPFQPTSIWVLPMQWQEASIHPVEHRNFENWSWQIALMICLWNLKTVTFHQYTSKQGYSPDPCVARKVWGPDYPCSYELITSRMNLQ